MNDLVAATGFFVAGSGAAVGTGFVVGFVGGLGGGFAPVFRVEAARAALASGLTGGGTIAVVTRPRAACATSRKSAFSIAAWTSSFAGVHATLNP